MAFVVAKSERVAVLALGDSNQRFGGNGWSHYMTRALGNTFGCYGTFADTKIPGAFQPVVHRHQAPNTILVSTPAPINPATGTYALERLTLDLPAAPSRSQPLQFSPRARFPD